MRSVADMEDLVVMKTGLSSIGRAFAYGECSGCIGKHLFSKHLAALGLEVEERAYSINVLEFERLTFEFDQHTDDMATIEGTAATLSVLRANAHRLHEVLTRGEVRHWIEVTDAVQNRLEILHYNWPDEG